MSTDKSTPSPESLLAAKEKAIAEELAKVPSIEVLEAQIAELKAKQIELSKLQDLKQNYGPGKPGKKRFVLPPLKAGQGRVTIQGEVMEGVKWLTHEDYTNYRSIYAARMEHEHNYKYGHGPKSVLGREGAEVALTGVSTKF